MTAGWPPPEEVQAEFRARCAEGHQRARLVARRLTDDGRMAWLPRQSINSRRPDLYRNEADLFVRTDAGNVRVEVKSTTYCFTTAADYAFDPLYVEQVSSFQRKKPRPLGYVIVCAKCLAMVWLSIDTFSSWSRSPQKDPRRKAAGKTIMAYVAPRSALRPFETFASKVLLREERGTMSVATCADCGMEVCRVAEGWWRHADGRSSIPVTLDGGRTYTLFCWKRAVVG